MIYVNQQLKPSHW